MERNDGISEAVGLEDGGLRVLWADLVRPERKVRGERHDCADRRRDLLSWSAAGRGCERNRAALDKVRADKLREVKEGHDGTWVAHPGLVAIAREVFDEHMPGPHQIERQREDVEVSAADLLQPSGGAISEAGIRLNLKVGIQYLEAWLGGNGCVPLYHLMEDAATAEISRAQVWQWLHHKATLADGRRLTSELYRQLLAEEMAAIRQELGDERYASGRFSLAMELFDAMIRADDFVEFLTLPAYGHI